MPTQVLWATLVVAGSWLNPAAASPVSSVPSPIDSKNLSGLTESLRGLLLESLPTPLYENRDHWDLQKEVTRGLKWKGRGLDAHAERQRSLKNDGLWWKVRVTAPEIAKALVFEVRDTRQAEPGKLTFTVFVAFDTDVEYERQRWDAGHRLFSTSIRGRAHVQLALACESTFRLEDKNKLLPSAVFRLRVLSSDFQYDDVVFEHVAGVGGEAAKLLGDLARSSLRQWRPSLEKRLVERGNAAILKAGDTKEVRIGLEQLLDKK